MITKMPPRLLTCIAVFFVAFAMACTDDPGTSSNDRPNGNNGSGPSEPVDETSKLLFYGDPCNVAEQSCSMTPSVGDSLSLQVQLLTADDEPIQNALIDFQKESLQNASEASLSGNSVYTGPDGVATVDLYMGGDEDSAEAAVGQLRVTASAADHDDVNNLEFHVGITPKDGAAYIIQYHHDGVATPDVVNTRLYDDSQSCDDAEDKFFNDGLWPSADMILPPTQVAPDGSIPDSTPPVNNGESFTVLALAEQHIGNERVEVAYGCNDDADTVTLGENVYVDVPLTDHVPHFGERYEMTHQFNLAAAMPESVQTVINIISTLADNPAEFILGCPRDSNGDPEPGCNTDTGLLDLVFDAGFLDGQDWIEMIENLRDGPLYDEAAEYLNGLIEDHVLSNFPDWVVDGIDIAGDVTDMLESFTVRGPVFFHEQPTRDVVDGMTIGEFDGVAEQRWDEIVFQFSLGCEDSTDPVACAETTVSASDLGTSDIIEGEFDATVYGTDYIEIERHHLSLHYGALIIGAIEQVVLPRLFDDPTVNSIDAMIAEFIDCADLAESIGTLETTIENVCYDMMGNATDAVYDYVTDALVADGEDRFMLSTPTDEPCTIQQPETYSSSDWPGKPRPYIESLGQGEDGTCTWKTEIDYNGDGDVNFEIPGDFDGALR